MRKSFASLTIALALLSLQCIAASAQGNWTVGGFTVTHKDFWANGSGVYSISNTEAKVYASAYDASSGAYAYAKYQQTWTPHAPYDSNHSFTETATCSLTSFGGNSSASANGLVAHINKSIGVGSGGMTDVQVWMANNPFTAQVESLETNSAVYKNADSDCSMSCR